MFLLLSKQNKVWFNVIWEKTNLFITFPSPLSVNGTVLGCVVLAFLLQIWHLAFKPVSEQRGGRRHRAKLNKNPAKVELEREIDAFYYRKGVILPSFLFIVPLNQRSWLVARRWSDLWSLRPFSARSPPSEGGAILYRGLRLLLPRRDAVFARQQKARHTRCRPSLWVENTG